MRLTILTLAHDISYSEPGNLLNISGIYTGLTASGFPVVLPRILLVARFTGSPVDYGREFAIMVNFIDEDGLPGPIPGDQKRLRMTSGQSGEDVHCIYTLEALDVTFYKPGWYQFFVHVDDQLVEELPVSVAKAARR